MADMENKNKRITIRMTETEYDILSDKAKTNVSAYVRRILFGKGIRRWLKL